MLDVSRIVSGQLSLNAYPFSVGKMVNAAVDAVRPSAEGKQVALEVALSADIGTDEWRPRAIAARSCGTWRTTP